MSRPDEVPASAAARTDQVWRRADLATEYLEGVRGGIPLAEEQIRILIRVLRAALPDLQSFLDLGCGDGVLGHAVLDAFPRARGVFLDFSEPMLAQAQARLAPYGLRVRLIHQDYGLADWQAGLEEEGQLDAVLSGFSIHHQANTRKRELYAEIFERLSPGGAFLNLEHVASASLWGQQLFDEHFIDALYAFHLRRGGGERRERMADRYYRRDDKTANILESVETQCGWLRDIGFERVDCFFKVFEIALFGGVKPG